jgi:uncharacterized delta-60 repeat protein
MERSWWGVALPRSLDTTFNLGANGEIYALALQPDGKILVGGSFTTLGGAERNYVGRINLDGSLDTTFNPGADKTVRTLALQPDGRIVVGGWFNTLGGETRHRIGRLNPNGTLDADFNPGAASVIYTLALQPDGRIIVGGWFTFERLNPDGTLDTTFNMGADNAVSALALRPDGKIVVGGDFTKLGEAARNHIGRLSSDTAALQNLSANSSGTAITWTRSGVGPEVWRVTFESSVDGVSYTPLGAGTRITGGWQLTGLTLPRIQNLFIRARGYYATGLSNGSSSIVESVRNIFVKHDTNTTITSTNPDPSFPAQAVVVNFTVKSTSGTPTGYVTVSDGVDSCMGSVAEGTCSLTLTTPGAHTLTATYAGNANFNGSSDTKPHTVNKADTTTTITTDSPDPSVVGQAIAVNFSVTSSSGTPTGNLTVSDGIDSCTGSVVDGTCSLTLMTSGVRTLTATYAGDANFNGSSDTEAHTVKFLVFLPLILK